MADHINCAACTALRKAMPGETAVIALIAILHVEQTLEGVYTTLCPIHRYRIDTLIAETKVKPS